ncbi:hypothetical protein AKJ40_03305 [candidate division MSBL1 archaeon SCGC-AAA259M10]|uniref:Uncharacterized protein n=1 Tax=candidate division MSBL1 archaeon SCGC-AAA259M10 TaxID=1698270 RepID=A0A133UYX0_9EURY|nr:hypothetical protein AKJ40_03305 [candidate division MSBL1 archaeon SCGC-AAA259M10]
MKPSVETFLALSTPVVFLIQGFGRCQNFLEGASRGGKERKEKREPRTGPVVHTFLGTEAELRVPGRMQIRRNDSFHRPYRGERTINLRGGFRRAAEDSSEEYLEEVKEILKSSFPRRRRP